MRFFIVPVFLFYFKNFELLSNEVMFQTKFLAVCSSPIGLFYAILRLTHLSFCPQKQDTRKEAASGF